MAVAHSIAIAFFFVLQGNEFKDLGADYYTQFSCEKKINSHLKQLSKLGVNLTDEILHSARERPLD